ncbi:MBL fold metallo-hydrolase [candidate division KSB1 bacterium]|nr:MBL fold metallo-hydrolase [candidate division KSB1 bacterium]MBL7094378.1 MBL fold metallo-hydrolase [candidate division KSB1 bacterium]
MKNKKSTKHQITLTVLFDNISYSPKLKTEWGFSCVIKTGSDTILFDTGSNGKILLQNMEKLQIDPHSITSVIISHDHWDHVGGLADFLNVADSKAKVFILNSFTNKTEKEINKTSAKVIRVDLFRRIATGIFSLGELKGKIAEQSLAIRTAEGIVVITGCAHPGIVNILRHAHFILSTDQMYLVMGGFHLKNDNREEITKAVNEIYKLDVKNVAPSHCTGKEAIDIFAQVFGDRFIKSGVGRVIEINGSVKMAK